MMTANGRGAAPSPLPWQERGASLSEAWLAKAREERERRIRETEPWEVTLPSGMAVIATRPPLASLIQANRLPAVLLPFVADLMMATRLREGWDGHPSDHGAAYKNLIREHQEDMRGFLRAVWIACVVSPEFVVDDAGIDAGKVPVSVVEDADLEALFNFAQGVEIASIRGLAAFPYRSGEPLRTAPDGEGLRLPSGRPARRGPAERPGARVEHPETGVDVRDVGGGAAGGDGAGAGSRPEERAPDEDRPEVPNPGGRARHGAGTRPDRKPGRDRGSKGAAAG